MQKFRLMGTEIERKYLLQGDGWKTPDVLTTQKNFVQTYLATNEGSSAILANEPEGMGFCIYINRSAGYRDNLVSVQIPLSAASYSELLKEAKDGVLPIEIGFEARIRLANSDRKVGAGRITTIGGGQATLTLKGGKGLERSEFEATLDYAAAQDVLADPANIVGSPIVKSRYRAALPNGLVAEIDIYSDANVGLEVVEVELPDVGAKVPATPWIGRDITNGDFSNARLAVYPMSERGLDTPSL